MSSSSEAWRDFCRRLEAAGDTLLEGVEGAGPEDEAEGYRHLARLAEYALQWHLEFHDPEFPAFHRYDDDVVKWGGPNTDNHYFRAKIDPNSSYRLRFDARGVREVLISTPEGEMQFDQYKVFEERCLADLETGEDGNVEIVLGEKPGTGNWIPLDPAADHVLIRVYSVDWERDAVPVFFIEKIGNEGCAPERLAPQTLASRLDGAANWIERTLPYWKRFMAQRRAAGRPNELATPVAVPGGAQNILYGGGSWQLENDECLLVESELPHATYSSFQLYSEPWFESLDFANRVTSLNDRQIHVDADGRFRIVVSAKDPGVPNWLDTEGRRGGLVSHRVVGANESPAVESRKLELADLRDELPGDVPIFDEDARRKQIAGRRTAVTHRFRK
jgi:hypothetical protein